MAWGWRREEKKESLFRKRHVFIPPHHHMFAGTSITNCVKISVCKKVVLSEKVIVGSVFQRVWVSLAPKVCVNLMTLGHRCMRILFSGSLRFPLIRSSKRTDDQTAWTVSAGRPGITSQESCQSTAPQNESVRSNELYKSNPPSSSLRIPIFIFYSPSSISYLYLSYNRTSHSVNISFPV